MTTITLQCVNICILRTKAIYLASENNRYLFSVRDILYNNTMGLEVMVALRYSICIQIIESGIGFTCQEWETHLYRIWSFD